MDGLAQNDLDNYTHLLTGYVGSASFLKRIAGVVRALKDKNPDLVYVCDPVLGDNGLMYVPDILKDIYKTEIVPLADILTPNQYELELLTGIKIDTMSDVQNAVKELHKAGPRIVAVSSTDIDNKLTAIVSTIEDNTLIKINIPKLPTNFTGSGDLFAALFLAHTYLQDNIKDVIEKTVNSLHMVLRKTYEHSQASEDKESQPAKRIELQLIHCKNYIENPEIHLHAEPLI